jgi:hypothetical protein
MVEVYEAEERLKDELGKLLAVDNEALFVFAAAILMESGIPEPIARRNAKEAVLEFRDFAESEGITNA